MNIRNWPIGKILQLPDHVFGARFPISIELTVGGGVTEYAISELSFPEKAVSWNVSIFWGLWSAAGSTLQLGIKDTIPVSPATISACEELLPGVGEANAGPNFLHGYQYSGHEDFPLRMPVEGPARRLVGAAVSSGGATSNVRVVVTVSSVPGEVPDCVLSE